MESKAMNSCVYPQTTIGYGVHDGSYKSGDHVSTKELSFVDKVSQGKRNKRVPWSKSEDELLRELVMKYGEKKWKLIAERVPGRTGKQCRQRWLYNLTPELRKTSWTEQEDIRLLSLHKELGNRWTQIRRNLPGRSENDVKNHFHCLMNRIEKNIPSALLLLQLSQLHPFSPDSNTTTAASSPVDDSNTQVSCDSIVVSDPCSDSMAISEPFFASDPISNQFFSMEPSDSLYEVEDSPLTSLPSLSDAFVSLSDEVVNFSDYFI